MARRGALAWVTLAGALLAGQGGALGAGPTGPACPGGRLMDGTFLQPTRALLARDGPAWDRLFAEMADLGLREVFLQWSASGGALRGGAIEWPESESPRALAGRVLDRAEAHGLRAWIGLSHTPAWWERIDRSRRLESVATYLRRRLFVNRAAAVDVAPVVRAHPAFAGWYVSEEIDDRNWIEPARRHALVDYLGDLAQQLDELTPGRPVAISGFATGWSDPASLARQWEAILAGAPIDLVLLQDGIGAQHLSLEELAIVVPPLAATVERARRKLGVVVELFTQTAGAPLSPGPFVAGPAPLRRIAEQLAFARRWATGPVVGFSLPDYASRSAGGAPAALYEELTSWQRRCFKSRERGGSPSPGRR